MSLKKWWSVTTEKARQSPRQKYSIPALIEELEVRQLLSGNPVLTTTGSGWSHDSKSGAASLQYALHRHDPAGSSTLTVSSPVVSGSNSGGSAITLVATSGPSHGTLTLHTDSTFTYTSAAGYTGTDAFILAYRDSFGNQSHTATIYLTSSVQNAVPILTTLGTGWTIDSKSGILNRQFSVPRHDPTASSTIKSSTPIVSGLDADGNAITLVAASGTAHGTLSLNADSSFTYTSAAGYTGSDAFILAYQDHYGNLSNRATIYLNCIVQNAPPVLTTIGSNWSRDGKTGSVSQQYTLIRNIPTANSTLTVSNPVVSGSDAGGLAITLVATSNPAHGTFSLNGDSTFTYTSSTGYSGTDAVTVAYRDVYGNLSNRATIYFTCRVLNAPPTLTTIGTAWNQDSKTGHANRLYSVPRHNPAGSSTLSISSPIVSVNDADANVISLVTTSNPAHGTVSLNADSTFTYSSIAGYIGTDAFTVAYRDSYGNLSNPATIYLTSTVQNAAPVLSGLARIAYFRHDPAKAIESAIAVTDTDDATLVKSIAAITNFVSSEDVLGFVNDGSTMGNIAGNWDGTLGLMTLTSAGATATVSQWQAALRALTYSNTSDNPNTTTRNITFTIDDGQSTNHVSNTIVGQVDVSQRLITPQITNLSNHTGNISGGTSVTIAGSGFTQVSAVLFGGVVATSFTVDSSSSITAIAPAHGAGTVDVTVVTSMGSSKITTGGQFTYQFPIGVPTVSAVSPNRASSSGGDAIKVTGTNFTGATSVSFGNVPAASFTLTSPTTIVAIAPTHVSGQVSVQVTTSSGTSATNPSDALIFTIPTMPPIVTGLSTSTGSAAGGTSITILGLHFADVTGVMFGNVAATSFVANSSTTITAVVPSEATGIVNVTVTNSEGTSSIVPADQYTFESATPTILAISTATGSANGGTAVTITGTNFDGVTAVKFGNIPASSFTHERPGTITVIAPATTTGVVDITVHSAHGTSGISAADEFTFGTPPPVVTGLSILSGPITGGTSITIWGSDLAGATAVRFGSVSAASFVVNADGTVTVVSPAMSGSSFDVTVTTAAGTSATSYADRFIFQDPGSGSSAGNGSDPPVPGVPIVDGLDYSGGSTLGGDTVTIYGIGFKSVTGVLFGTVAATSFTIVSDNTMTAIVPAQMAGKIDIVLQSSTGAFTPTGTSQFAYSEPNSVPVVTRLTSSSSHVIGAGSLVKIEGTNFSGVTGILFGSAIAVYVVESATTILAVVPSGVTGSVNVAVTSGTGTSAATSASQVSLAPTALVNSIPNLPAVTGPEYVVTSSGIPDLPLDTFSSRQSTSAAGLLDLSNWGVATPLPIWGDHPVGTTMGSETTSEFESGSRPDGSVIIRAYTETSSFMLAGATEGDPNALLWRVMTTDSTSTTTDILLAANGTGYVKVFTFSADKSFSETVSSTQDARSSNQIYTSTTTDFEFGLGAVGATDHKSQSNISTSTSHYTNSGIAYPRAAWPNGGTAGVASISRVGSDMYLNTDTNNTATDVASQQILGSDAWNGGSSGTYAYSPNSMSDVEATCHEDYSGHDSFIASDVNTTTTVSTNTTGATTVHNVATLNDKGFDEYDFGSSGRRSDFPDRSTYWTESHDNHDDGNEIKTVGNTGWVGTSGTLDDGSLLISRDDIADSNQDKSNYVDSDIGYSSSSVVGSDQLRDKSHDGITFSTTDDSKITETSTNSYGTVTTAAITDKLGDSGTVSIDPTFYDVRTLAIGGPDIADATTFDTPVHESDLAKDSLRIVVKILGLVAAGEFVDSTETITLEDSSPTTQDLGDPGTSYEHYAANSDTWSGVESDNATNELHSKYTGRVEHLVAYIDTATLPDGTVTRIELHNDDIENIDSKQDDVNGDVHAVTPDYSGLNSVVTDNNTFDDKSEWNDNFTNDDSSSKIVTTRVAGGTQIVGFSAYCRVANGDGLLTKKDEQLGRDDTGSPISNYETDTKNLDRIDKGTTGSNDWLSVNATDPITRVVTIIQANYTLTDGFTDNDGDTARHGTSAVAPTSDTEFGNAIITDDYTNTSTDMIRVVGNPSPILFIDFLENPSTNGGGTDSNDVEYTSGAVGSDIVYDIFSGVNHEALTGTGHSNVSQISYIDDGHGGSVNINESDNSVFGMTGGFQDSLHGREDYGDSNGQRTSDIETDTDVLSGQLYPATIETVNAHDIVVSVDPTTGLISTATDDNNASQDTKSSQITESSTDVHGASLSNPGSDILSGFFNIRGQDVFLQQIIRGLHLHGPDAQGNVLDLQITQSEKDITNSSSKNDETLSIADTDTETTDVLNNYQDKSVVRLSGTTSHLDPITGNVITTVAADEIDGTLNDTIDDGHSLFTRPSGTTVDTPTPSEGGFNTTAMKILEVTTQTTPSGVVTGTAIANSADLTETDTSSNGVIMAGGPIVNGMQINLGPLLLGGIVDYSPINLLKWAKAQITAIRKGITDLPATLQKLKELDAATVALAKTLALDLAQMSLDLIGIIEPTPFADGSNTAISLLRCDWIGAGLNALGMVPYLGDLAKLGKLGKYAKIVTDVIELASKSPELKSLFRPLLKRLRDSIKILEDAPAKYIGEWTGEAVEGVLGQLRNMRQRIDLFLNNKWGNYLENTLKVPKPTTPFIVNGTEYSAHAHHIVMKEGLGAAGKLAAEKSRAILKKHRIDTYTGKENLIWAPNLGHPDAYAEAV